MYIEVYVIMIVTWVLELHSIYDSEEVGSTMVIDALKCFSAMVIFTIFVLKKDVRVLIHKRLGSFYSAGDYVVPESP